MSNCSDCNWFGTRAGYCSRRRKTVNPHDAVCDEFWPIVRPTPPIEEENTDHFNICTDCLEKGYFTFNDFKYCPICGKELKK